MTFLSRGCHDHPSQGVNLLEHVSQLAEQKFSDYPEHVSPVLATLLRNVCDDCRDSFRPELLQFAQPLVNTFRDWTQDAAREAARAWIVADWLVRAQCYLWAEVLDTKPTVKTIKELPPVKRASADAARAVVAQWTERLRSSDGLDAWAETDLPGMAAMVKERTERDERESLSWAANCYGITQVISDIDERVAHLNLTQAAHSAIRSAIRLIARRQLSARLVIDRIEGSLVKVVDKCLAL